MPLSIMGSAIVFNVVNGTLNGLGMSMVDVDGFWENGSTWIGLALFISGALLNLSSDQILMDLRKPGETDYRIPRKGLFNWVSSPNYLGEIVECNNRRDGNGQSHRCGHKGFCNTGGNHGKAG